MIELDGWVIEYWSDCSTAGRGEAIVNFGFRMANYELGNACAREWPSFTIHYNLQYLILNLCVLYNFSHNQENRLSEKNDDSRANCSDMEQRTDELP